MRYGLSIIVKKRPKFKKLMNPSLRQERRVSGTTDRKTTAASRRVSTSLMKII